ncbi:DoxX family protein [Luteimonas sp. R10]|uniref:DoxX family protein n=1 Tax=Luteimonas sp. R10 TaxID=3108176 RepID=UPI0030862CB0|nr:DoxX family protein [Luteimonas sp. R10]
MNQAAMQDLARLLLRATLGALILMHGVAKLRNGLDPIESLLQMHGWPTFLAYGALVGEVLAPLMLIVGFHARLGAVLVAVHMLFALWLAHLGQFGQLNAQGGWALELQAMFLVAAVTVALLGPGRFSVNAR